MAYEFSTGARIVASGGADILRTGISQPNTISALIYPRSLGGSGLGRIIFRQGTSTTLGTGLNLIATNRLQFGVDGTTKLDIQSANNAITLNTWQHVACVWDGSSTGTGVSLYVNGVEVSYALRQNGVNPQSTAGRNVIIGNRADFAREFDGFIAELAVWQATLSAAEIASLAKAFAPHRINLGLQRFYPPLVRSVIDLRSQASLTVTSATAAPHPRVY